MKKSERRVVSSAVQQKRYKLMQRWKRWRRNRNRVYNHRSRDTQPKSSSGITVRSKRQNVAFPVDSRLIENLEEVLGALDKVRHSLDSREKIYVDLSGVEDISMSTILYLINLFDRAKSPEYRGNLDVKGNLPASKKARDLLEQSGFYQYVKTGPGTTLQSKPNREVFPIRDGSSGDREMPAGFRKFASAQYVNFNDKRKLSFAVYDPLLEAMQNAADHAYKGGSKDRWWAGATCSKGVLEICVLDNGRSIPATIRGRLQISKKSDHAVIAGAFDGKYKSSTKKRNRGNGLASMKEAYEKKYISELQCVSRHGMVDLDGKKLYLPRQFYGTLLRWKVRLL